MKHTLKAGLHAAVITSPKAGYGGSMLGWETYMVCKRAGIPAIIATFDRYRTYPPNIGEDLRRLPTTTAAIATEEEMANCLKHIVKEARDIRKFLIIDTQSGFQTHDSMFGAMMRAGLAEANSLAALVAVWSGVEKSRDPFAEFGITFTRTLFRYWGLKSDLARIPSNNTTHRWIPRYLSNSAVQNIKEGSAKSFFPIGEEYPGENAQTDGSHIHLSEVVEHLTDAVKNIFPALLEPISDPVPEVPAEER